MKIVNSKYCEGIWFNYFASTSFLEKDLGLWRADGVLEVLEARRKNNVTVLFSWDEHYERFVKSCNGHIPLEDLPPEADIKGKVNGLLITNKFSSALVHILATPGYSEDLKKVCGPPTLVVDVGPLVDPIFKPLKLRTVGARRFFPSLKLVSGYGYARRFQAIAERDGFDSFLYSDIFDGILEGPYENLFVVTKAGSLMTPAHGMLPGITRKVLLRLAKDSGLFKEVLEKQINISTLTDCREAFLSSTTKGAMPIYEINGVKFEAETDNLTHKLRELFINYRENYYMEHGAG